MNFDFARFPDTAQVQRAVLAVHTQNNTGYFRDTAALRGRLNIGDAFQSLGAQRDAQSPAGWVIFDITALAARAINEQRPSVSFEVSLPCGRDESELTAVSLLSREPVVLVEYR
jgi:hypothetical protein